MSTQRALTVKTLAERFGKDPARIRQISIENNIGKLLEGRVRLFTEHEAARIQRILGKIGRSSKNSARRRDSDARDSDSESGY